VMTSLDKGEPGPILSDRSTLPDEPPASPAISVTESPKPEERS
jgi:hypothetical protein